LRPARLRSQLLPTPKQGSTAREGPSTPCLRRAPPVGVRPPCMLPTPHPPATTTILASRIFSWGHGAECNHRPVQPTIEGFKVKYQPQNERAGFRRSHGAWRDKYRPGVRVGATRVRSCGWRYPSGSPIPRQIIPLDKVSGPRHRFHFVPDTWVTLSRMARAYAPRRWQGPVADEKCASFS
jgi:hypothetical protein